MPEQLYRETFRAFDGKTVEQKLQEIADREEIRELVARYAHGIARQAQVADLFTADGIFIQKLPGQVADRQQGLDALRLLFDKITSAAGLLPMIHNHVVEIDGNDARGLCSVEVRMTVGGKSMIASGYYEDEYRRVAGRWRFAKRDATILHLCTLQEGWAEQTRPILDQPLPPEDGGRASA